MIWNPHAFGATGQPIRAQAPPSLRVEGGYTATPEQTAMAQQVFARFSALQRVSPVPNPSESGKLADGTPYRITVVGPQAVMQIWPAATDDDRISGIAITLVNLDGSTVPGHVNADGEPQLYLLTPRVRGARISTGKWRVRKPKVLLGGKAVNGGPDGKLYFTGVNGNLNNSIPLNRNTLYGINGLAYDNEFDGTNTPVYRGNSQRGRSRNNPIPFHYKSGGTSHAMQLVLRTELEDAGPRQYLDLYVGPPSVAPDFIGELVSTFNVPATQSVDENSITFKADGTQARAIGEAPGGVAQYTILISPTGVELVLDSAQSAKRSSGFLWNLSVDGTSSGTPGQPGYTTIGYTIFGAGDGSDPYGSTRPYVQAGPGPGTDELLGEVDFFNMERNPYLFDRRGLPRGEGVDRIYGHSSGKHERTVTTVYQGELMPGVGYTTFTTVDTERVLNTINGPEGPFTIQQYQDDRTLITYYENSTSVDETVSGSGFSKTDSGGGPAPIYEDTELDFVAFYDRRITQLRAWNWVKESPGVSGNVIRQFTQDEVVTESKFKVTCRGVTLLSLDFDAGEVWRFRVFLASDPMTGALVVNLQEVNGSTGPMTIRRSWLFAVDDQGAKRLDQILPLPEGSTSIKVLSNAALFSV